MRRLAAPLCPAAAGLAGRGRRLAHMDHARRTAVPSQAGKALPLPARAGAADRSGLVGRGEAGSALGGREGGCWLADRPSEADLRPNMVRLAVLSLQDERAAYRFASVVLLIGARRPPELARWLATTDGRAGRSHRAPLRSIAAGRAYPRRTTRPRTTDRGRPSQPCHRP